MHGAGMSEPQRDFDTHDAGSSQDLMPSRGFAAGESLVHASKGIVRMIRMGKVADYFNCERVYVRGTRLKKGCVPHMAAARTIAHERTIILTLTLMLAV